jgi:hypothetical protein
MAKSSTAKSGTVKITKIGNNKKRHGEKWQRIKQQKVE